MKKLLLLTILAFVVDACTTVPITGRRQLATYSNQDLIPMSFESYKVFMDTNQVAKDQDQIALVKKVGKRIQTAVEKYMGDNGLSRQLDGFEWEFNLIEEDIVNAWAMPGGKVAFYTGIMPICQDESGVAVVMGHEIAHAIAGHGAERMSEAQLAQLGGAVAGETFGSGSVYAMAFGVGANLTMLSFSRKHESEADHIGLIFMAIAGYDPHEAPGFWERMSAESGGGAPPEFVSTHPSHETRISDLNGWIPEAMEYYQNIE